MKHVDSTQLWANTFSISGRSVPFSRESEETGCKARRAGDSQENQERLAGALLSSSQRAERKRRGLPSIDNSVGIRAPVSVHQRDHTGAIRSI